MVMFDPLGGGDRAMFIQTTATQAGRLTRGRFSVPGHDGREPGAGGGGQCVFPRSVLRVADNGAVTVLVPSGAGCCRL